MNYKITNLSSGAIHFLNESEKETFFKINYLYKNGSYQYEEENLTERKNKIKDKALTLLTYICLYAAFTLSLLLYIKNYY
tara:strand:+ start:460 stop:699 length:240 start_codon:yes stop_codon:yes gene_type:complete